MEERNPSTDDKGLLFMKRKKSTRKRSIIKAYRRKWRRLPREDQVFVVKFLGTAFVLLIVIIVLLSLLIAHIVKSADAGESKKSNKVIKETSASAKDKASSEDKVSSDDASPDGDSSEEGAPAEDEAEVTGASSPDAEVELLARLVNAEAGDVSRETQIAVASVILNRVNSDKFPDTISEVIYQSGQYTTVSGSKFNETPNDASIESAAYVYQNGSQIPENVLYQSLTPLGGGVWKQLDGNYFCYE